MSYSALIRSYCLRFGVRVRFPLALGMGGGSLDIPERGAVFIVVFYTVFYTPVSTDVCTPFHATGKIIAAVHIQCQLNAAWSV